MVLTAGCPRCPALVLEGECPDHGRGPALWRAEQASYDAFGEVLQRAAGFPAYLPWPPAPGWSVSDVAVAVEDRALATLACVSGTSELDGPVDLAVVAEEAGVGLGARCAGLRYADPGPEVAAAMRDGAPSFRFRTEWQQVTLWLVSTGSGGADATGTALDRSVVVGEADGRWLWVVVRPASALLMLGDGTVLRDLSSAGPEALDLPFGGPRPDW